MEFKSPAYNVIAIPLDKIRANAYNPNIVAPPERKLLYLSIKEDGYTMPVVVYHDPDVDLYEIVDGFNRYMVMIAYKDICIREKGLLPCTIIDKPISNRMASTIRHNRARGSHDLNLMTQIVAELTKMGKSNNWIIKNLGMDPDELLRLKQITGLADLYKDREFSKAWDVQPEISKEGS